MIKSCKYAKIKRSSRRITEIGKYYRLNQNIQSSELRVIDSSGNQLGVISKSEALQKAQEANLDLVEVAPNAKPPVARIIDFEKFRYDENKKEQAAKKRAKDVELKELWFTPRIAQHDIDTRLRRVDQFLKNNNKVMIRIKFKGREMGHQQAGYDVLQKVFEALGDQITVERAPKFEGRSLTAIIGRATSKSGTGVAKTV